MAGLLARAAPLLLRLDPERAHRLSIWALARGLAPRQREADPAILACRRWGLDFPNPLGIAAGYDKDAEAVRGLFDLGFGFVEVGTITPRPQAGNPRPRVFRLPEIEGVINRYGFNSKGLEAAERRLAALRRDPLAGPLGINIGKNRDSEDARADYRLLAERLSPYADYLVVNVSSPNTAGLRDLQGRAALAALIDAVRSASETAPKRPALLVKIAPDLDEAEIADIAAVALESELDGLIVSNTTIARPEAWDRDPHYHETGGLSGPPLAAPATDLLARLHVATEGKVRLVGVGGIGSGAEAWTRIVSGASLLQLYTALIYRGPDLIGAIKAELAERLEAGGFASLDDAVGRGAKERLANTERV